MTPDERLNALLKAGPGLEPSPGFEGAVWRRLHAEEPVQVKYLRGWVMPLALAAGLIAGIGVGLLFPAPGIAVPKAAALGQNGSLTQAYLMLASGGDP
jgi:hypothetical protein